MLWERRQLNFKNTRVKVFILTSYTGSPSHTVPDETLQAMRLNTCRHSEQHPSFFAALTAFFGSSVLTSPHTPVSEPHAVEER